MNKLNYYIIRILTKIKIISRINFTVSQKINGRNFKIPFTGSKMGTDNLSLGERWFSDIFKELYQNFNEPTFIDIGMNIGQTVLKVKSIAPKINYVGFEPNGVCTNYLYELINLNKIENIKVIPTGLGAFTSIQTLYADNKFASGASVIKGFRQNQKIKFMYSVPILSGDDVKNSISDRWDIVKIDVEGYELDVISGISKILLEDFPTIICEILPNYGKTDSERYQRQTKLEQLLQRLNYTIYRIDEEKSKLIKLDTIGVFESMEETNYLFQPNSKVREIDRLLS